MNEEKTRQDILFGDIRDNVNIVDTIPTLYDLVVMTRIEVQELRKQLKIGEPRITPVGWYWEELTNSGWIEIVDFDKPEPYHNRKNIRPLTFLTSIN